MKSISNQTLEKTIMTTYITAEFTPKDQEKLQSYSAQAAPLINQFNGEFLVKGAIEALNGTANHKFKAIIAFPTRELALTWYQSPEYQALITNIRDEAMDAQFQLIGN